MNKKLKECETKVDQKDQITFKSREIIKNLNISSKTLHMLDSSIDNFKKGIVSKSVK